MIENYKELLYAIFNSDESESERKSVICVYDILDNEKLVGVFTKSQACGDFFNTSSKTIDCEVHRGNLKANRYKLERVNIGD